MVKNPGEKISKPREKTSNASRKVQGVETATIEAIDAFGATSLQGEELRHATRLAIYKLEHSAGRAGGVVMNDDVVRLVKQYLALRNPHWVYNAQNKKSMQKILKDRRQYAASGKGAFAVGVKNKAQTSIQVSTLNSSLALLGWKPFTSAGKFFGSRRLQPATNYGTSAPPDADMIIDSTRNKED